MNKFLKYIFYFTLFILLYLLITKNIIEGYNIDDFKLLFKISKDRHNVGCQNFVCEQDPIYVNPYSKWNNKINSNDENYTLCNNFPSSNVLSSLGSGVRCNKELCCEDRSCHHIFFNKGFTCNNKMELRNNECPTGTEGIDCEPRCCGIPIRGQGELLFNSIKNFKNKIWENSVNSNDCDVTSDLSYLSPDENPNTITLLDLRNYIYFNTLDLHSIETNNDDLNIGTTYDYITYCDFNNLQTYLTTIYDEIINNASTDEEKINNLKTTVILDDDSRIKIKDNYINSDLTVSQNLNRLTNNSIDKDNIFSEIIYGITSKEQIKQKYSNFIQNYTDYDETTSDTNEELKKIIKINMVLLGNPSLFSSDNNRTPLDSLLSIESQEYKTVNISSNDLQIIL